MRREGKIVGNRVVLVLLKIRTLGGKNSCTENSVTLTWVNRNCGKTLKTKVSLLYCLIIVLIWLEILIPTIILKRSSEFPVKTIENNLRFLEKYSEMHLNFCL